MRSTRRRALRGLARGLSGAAALGVVGTATVAAARSAPDHVTVSYDEGLIKTYQPSLVLENVQPEPQAFHALHATSTKSSLNAVYGFAKYPYQEGIGRQDSHLGDHEPIISWYDPSDEEVVRVDYAGYHWFRASLSEGAIPTATDARQRPLMAVDPTYHHYYGHDGPLAGTRLDVEDLTSSIDRWLAEGLDSELALTQPYNPWDMLARRSWWRDTAGNSLDATLKALWFNTGLSGATETSDLDGVTAW